MVLRLTLLFACASLWAQHDAFEIRVRPVLAARCQGCHGGKTPMAGIDLTSADGTARVDSARIHNALRSGKMPPSARLKPAELDALVEWVAAGKKWPTASARRGDGSWWSFQPLGRAADNDTIDRFLDAKLAQAGLKPAPPADRATLLRRVTFDLTGLPPTPAEIESFQADRSPDAWRKVVDRLLASPRYGEHWGRHWLDVARYADSTGADEDHRYPHAWRYRDWVIRAFNTDMPFDRFARDQIAGDTYPAPAGAEVNVDGIVATGFLALGPKLIAEQDKKKMFYDIVDEQIEVVGKAFLGLTIACARCHDHKFDPISTKDYYSLASIFASSKQLAKLEGTVSQLWNVPLVGKSEADAWQKGRDAADAKQKELDSAIGAEQTRYRERFALRMAEYMRAAREVYEGGRDADSVARERGLEPGVVKGWAAYLKPSGERRIYLERWYADPGSAPDYQRDYEETVRIRAQAREDWKKAAEAAKAKGDPPPEMPRFLAGDNRFFTEVVAAGGPFKIPEELRETDKVKRLRAELKAAKDAAPADPPLACAVTEDTPIEQRVFVRGNPEALGDPVAKRFPTVLAGESQAAIASGSGRRELAEWTTRADHPLTARVMVNRIWQWHFGEGLVRTPNNFGKLGDPPSHPELVDWLAARFVAGGWSVKAMHRLILESAAYQRSSIASPEARSADPDNRLLSHFHQRRLAVEEMRDALLAIDGTLDTSMGGSLQSGTGTDKEFAEGRKSIDPDKQPRRMVYLPLRRSNLPTVLNLFDFGDATTSNEGRTQTNVAPQALYMMNGEFVASRAANLAARLRADGTLDDRGRLGRAHMAVFGRPAADPFLREAAAYLERFPGPDRALAWTSLCRALISSNDFLYVQ
jgi:dsDNA-binding SOS-regulon protein